MEYSRYLNEFRYLYLSELFRTFENLDIVDIGDIQYDEVEIPDEDFGENMWECTLYIHIEKDRRKFIQQRTDWL
jgi:hypothetical protein